MLMQTITSDPKQLLQKYENDAWVSLSGWSSHGLMPKLVCEGKGKPDGCCSSNVKFSAQVDNHVKNDIPEDVYEDLVAKHARL